MHPLNQLVLDENNVAFHPMIGNSYQLNGIGKEIVEILQQGKTKDEIIAILIEKYEIDKNTLFIDIGDFIAKLKIYGLLS